MGPIHFIKRTKKPMCHTNPAGDSWWGQIHKHVPLLTQQRWSMIHRRHQWSELSLWLLPSVVPATGLKSQDTWSATASVTHHTQAIKTLNVINVNVISCKVVFQNELTGWERLELLTEAFPASTARKNFRHSSQLPLFSSACWVKVSIQCNQYHVVVTFLKELSKLNRNIRS